MNNINLKNCERCQKCNGCNECSDLTLCQDCYNCHGGYNNENLEHCNRCRNCSNCQLCKDCDNCSFCFECCFLKNKMFYIKNIGISEEDFFVYEDGKRINAREAMSCCKFLVDGDVFWLDEERVYLSNTLMMKLEI